MDLDSTSFVSENGGNMSRVVRAFACSVALGGVFQSFLWPKPAAAQWPATLSVGDAHVTVLGRQNRLGTSVTTGDINGDGWTDLVLLAGAGRGGEIHIVWGPVSTNVIDVGDPALQQAVLFLPSQAWGSVSTVRCADLNGDGRDDVALGVPCTLACGGRVHIIFGQDVFPDTVNIESPTIPITTIFPAWADGWLGYAMTHGDIDGDSFDDLIVSAPGLYPGGHVFIVHGRSNFPQTINLLNAASAGVTVLIESEWGWGAGQSLACADVNNDGASDLLIGTPDGDGKATFFYGSSNLPDTVMLSVSTPGTKHISADPAQPVGLLGVGSALVDVDGDGAIDILLSASGYDAPDCSECGMVYVFYDADGLPTSFNVTSASLASTRIVGGPCWGIGKFLVGADLTADGRAEVVVSAEPGCPPDLTKTVVVYGAPGRPELIHADVDTSVTVVRGETNDDQFGQALWAGDLNGDAILDLCVGARKADVGPFTDAGKAYVFHGIATATSVGGTLTPRVTLRAFPVPATSAVSIEYSLSRSSDVTLTVYNVRGQRVFVRRTYGLSTGTHVAQWNTRDSDGGRLPSGVYFCRVEALGTSATRKLVLLR